MERLAEPHYNTPLEHLYGRTPLDYLSALSIRYSNSVFQHEGFALWLFTIWVVDGILDSKAGCDADREAIISVLEKKETTYNSVIVEFFKKSYGEYLEHIKEYENSYEYSKVVEYTILYIRGEANDDYEEWRLIDGCMMAVVWQVAMLTGEKVDERAGRLVSLIVSYHNDLLSLDRDLKQKTPNLVLSYGEEDIYVAFEKAYNKVKDMEREVE